LGNCHDRNADQKAFGFYGKTFCNKDTAANGVFAQQGQLRDMWEAAAG